MCKTGIWKFDTKYSMVNHYPDIICSLSSGQR